MEYTYANNGPVETYTAPDWAERGTDWTMEPVERKQTVLRVHAQLPRIMTETADGFDRARTFWGTDAMVAGMCGGGGSWRVLAQSVGRSANDDDRVPTVETIRARVVARITGARVVGTIGTRTVTVTVTTYTLPNGDIFTGGPDNATNAVAYAGEYMACMLDMGIDGDAARKRGKEIASKLFGYTFTS